jgi:hypothetical protein
MKNKIFFRLFLSATALALFFVPTSAHSAPGDLYVAEGSVGQGTISKFTPAGDKSTFASGLAAPVALAFDRQGNLFVGNTGASGISATIVKITPDGTQVAFATLTSEELLGMAFDGAGNLYVSNGDILKFGPDGTQSTFASGLDGAWPLAFDKAGNLYAGVNPSSILKFAPDGSSSTFVTFSSGVVAALAFDASGNLFAEASGPILKVTPAGNQSAFASGDFQNALGFDEQGNLFAVLYAFNSTEPGIVKFTPDGTKTTFALGPLFPSALAFEPVTEKLRNISARGLVGTGDNVLIGGFIVGGSALANNAVVVRAIGPSLSQAGISDPLQDPTLELHDSSGATIASNDDWQDTQPAQITASGLAPTNPKESAIFATLPAGAYTAVVRGASDTTGVALVEVYSVNQ